MIRLARALIKALLVDPEDFVDLRDTDPDWKKPWTMSMFQLLASWDVVEFGSGHRRVTLMRAKSVPALVKLTEVADRFLAEVVWPRGHKAPPWLFVDREPASEEAEPEDPMDRMIRNGGLIRRDPEKSASSAAEAPLRAPFAMVMTREELQALERAALARGMSPSTLARQLMFDARFGLLGHDEHTRYVTVPLTDSEHALLEESARASGQSMEQYIAVQLTALPMRDVIEKLLVVDHTLGLQVKTLHEEFRRTMTDLQKKTAAVGEAVEALREEFS